LPVAAAEPTTLPEAALEIRRPDQRTLMVTLTGSWTIRDRLPSATDIDGVLDDRPTPQRVTFDTGDLGRWDSGLLTFLVAVRGAVRARQIAFDPSGLPQGVQSLIRLASAVPERGEARGPGAPLPLLARLGTGWLSLSQSGQQALAFIGEAMLSLARMLTGRAQLRRSDLFLLIQQVGAQALPIVALISILVGLILAFVGSVQLKLFGAQIFVANLVAIGMTREMGAMMAAIIMAGRTGAAFAAQLGTMQVNEEIDALKTLGVDPMDFLVLPRMVALILMMPLLTVYANVLGIFGGVLVGVGMLDITPTQYWNQTVAWLRPADLALGVGKSVVFGIIIAVSGCLRGIQCGRNAAAVGAAATSAVVTAIVWIVVADGLFAVVTNVLGI
jgi:phospholipid/cholesterol/gamma-HCH transport system permease protein